MAEDEIRKHAHAAINAIKEPGKDWKHKIGEILLEVLIIIFAVTVSIWFHNWSESWKDRDEEREFLVGLREDLQADLVEMRADRDGYQKSLDGVRYFESVGNGGPFSYDSLAKYQRLFFSYTQFAPRVSRFEALKGSGKLDIVRNKKLLLEIADLYTKDFPNVIGINSWSYNVRQNNYVPYITSHIQLDKDGRATNWEEMLRTSQFRLLVKIGEGGQNSVFYYNAAIAKAEDITRQIDKELK